MTSLSIVGFGNHVNKNILPALNKMADVNIDAVYVRDIAKYQKLAEENGLKLKRIADLDLAESEWVYISTPIASHYDYAKQALLQGKHVICEKPLTDSVEKTHELFELAKSQQCKLHEVCMYTHHKQFKYLEGLVLELAGNIKTVHAKFTIPHLSETDIRYNKELCGGALLDVGYYPISVMVNLFGLPKNIKSIKKSQIGYEVDLTGSALFDYGDFYCIAEWGIGLPYGNELILETTDIKYTFPRVFSKPATLKTIVEISKGFDKESIELGQDDQFVNMFKKMFSNEIKLNNTLLITSVLEQIR